MAGKGEAAEKLRGFLLLEADPCSAEQLGSWPEKDVCYMTEVWKSSQEFINKFVSPVSACPVRFFVLTSDVLLRALGGFCNVFSLCFGLQRLTSTTLGSGTSIL